MRQNHGFISNVCERCGGSDMGYALSEMHVICGYGSRHDGEEIRVALCGECVDELFDYFQKTYKPERDNVANLGQ